MKIKNDIKSIVLCILVTLIFLSLTIFYMGGHLKDRQSAKLVESTITKHLNESFEKNSFLIEARGYCVSNNSGAIDLENVSWSNFNGGDHEKSLNHIRDYLSKNRFLTISRGVGGVVIVRWDDVSDYVLKRKLKKVSFLGAINNSSPAYVINKLWYADPIRLGIRDGSISYIGSGLGIFSTSPEMGAHLEGEMYNATIEDVLIKVASTFGGVIFYAECPRSGGVNFYVNYHYPKNW